MRQDQIPEYQRNRRRKIREDTDDAGSAGALIVRSQNIREPDDAGSAGSDSSQCMEEEQREAGVDMEYVLFSMCSRSCAAPFISKLL